MLTNVVLFPFFSNRKRIARSQTKMNPLKNIRAMNKLNPYAIVTKRAAILREEALKRRRAAGKNVRRLFYLTTIISSSCDEIHTSVRVSDFYDFNEVLSYVLIFT